MSLSMIIWFYFIIINVLIKQYQEQIEMLYDQIDEEFVDRMKLKKKVEDWSL